MSKGELTILLGLLGSAVLCMGTFAGIGYIGMGMNWIRENIGLWPISIICVVAWVFMILITNKNLKKRVDNDEQF